MCCLTCCIWMLRSCETPLWLLLLQNRYQHVANKQAPAKAMQLFWIVKGLRHANALTAQQEAAALAGKGSRLQWEDIQGLASSWKGRRPSALQLQADSWQATVHMREVLLQALGRMCPSTPLQVGWLWLG